MPCMTFRFTTECEVTLDGTTYEDIYLQFKDLCHRPSGFTPSTLKTPTPHVQIYPPASSTVYFEVDEQSQFNAMEIKGDFKQDILSNLPANWRRRIDTQNNTRRKN